MKYRCPKAIMLLILASILVAPIFAGEGEVPLKSIAVLEFEAKGVSTLEASTLTDRFRSELVQTKVFLQIERSKIEQIFNEQKLQISGTVNEDKLVEIGELLGAELLVIGSIGKLGSTYTIDLRLVDVQSGEIIASYFKDYRGEVDGLLGQFRIIAGEIAGKDLVAPLLPRVLPVSVASNTVTTTVLSDLAEAQLKAKKDAAEDYSKFIWGVGGAASGAGGSCLVPAVGGAIGAGAVAGAGYVMDASPPQSRMEEIASEEATLRLVYIQTYEKELKKNRAKWGGGGGMFGCCFATIAITMLISSTSSR